MTKEADFGWAFLEDVIGFIVNNYNPESIFGEDELADWATEWASKQIASVVLSEKQLIEWAESNGFVREE